MISITIRQSSRRRQIDGEQYGRRLQRQMEKARREELQERGMDRPDPRPDEDAAHHGRAGDGETQFGHR